jgi:hypothetical protein
MRRPATRPPPCDGYISGGYIGGGRTQGQERVVRDSRNAGVQTVRWRRRLEFDESTGSRCAVRGRGGVDAGAVEEAPADGTQLPTAARLGKG